MTFTLERGYLWYTYPPFKMESKKIEVDLAFAVSRPFCSSPSPSTIGPINADLARLAVLALSSLVNWCILENSCRSYHIIRADSRDTYVCLKYNLVTCPGFPSAEVIGTDLNPRMSSSRLSVLKRRFRAHVCTLTI